MDEPNKEADLADRWLKEIGRASRHESEWRKRSKKIIDRYRDEESSSEDETRTSRFNVLFANTEILKGVMYQRTPVPDVRRRFLDKNPVARQVAQILQRAISYSVDSYDFDGVMEGAVLDLLLPGRAVAVVKYVPKFGRQPLQDADGQPVVGEDGQPVFPKVYEEVRCEAVEWDMFRMKPARTWRKVTWLAFGDLYTRDDLKAAFGGEVGGACSLDWKEKESEEQDEAKQRALVWQVWDKAKRKVIFVSKGYSKGPLLEVDDPLGLEGFFPCPKPPYSIYSTTSLVPVPEFIQYQDQAIELDIVTARIDALVDQLRFRGVQDASKDELTALANAKDGEFVPIENLSGLMEAGGLDKLMMTAPLDTIARVLLGLYDQRDRILQIIYQITGLSDIVRGASKASETATAQEIKGRFANVRIGPRQKAIEKFARDLFRIKAEIIAEKFDPDTLKLMTGPDLWKVDMKNPETGQAQKVDATAQIMEMMRSDKLRGFNVNVESDSTVQPNANEEQRNRIEFLTAITGFVNGVGPAVQSGSIPKDVALEFLSFGARGFKMSPQLEDAIDRIGQQAEQDPQKQQQEGVQQAAQQVEMAVKQAEAQKAQAEAVEAQAKAREAQAKAREAQARASIMEAQAAAMGVVQQPPMVPQ